MPALAFDSYAYVKKLRDAGMPEKQAEVQAEAITGLIEARVATKQDLAEIQRDIVEVKREIAEMNRDLKRDIKELDVKLETSLKELESRLIIRLGGLLFVGIGALAVLIKLL